MNKTAKKVMLPEKLCIQLNLGLDGHTLADLEANRKLLDLVLGLLGRGKNTKWK